MAEDVYISIVDKQGSREAKWAGLFKFDPIQGYSGRLLSPIFEIKAGVDLFGLPDELDREALYCLVDGSSLATIIWPDFAGGAQIKNFAARLLELKIRHLIRNIHIDSTEKEITAIRLFSPILAHLFRLNAFESTLETAPYKITITSLDSPDLEFTFSAGKFLIGTSATYSPIRPSGHRIGSGNIQRTHAR